MFLNMEVIKIGIFKSKIGIVDIRINISTIKCLGSGYIFRVGRGIGNILLIYLRFIIIIIFYFFFDIFLRVFDFFDR